MSATRATTPENPVITDFWSSSSKSSHDVTSHNRDEMARMVLPRRTSTVDVGQFFKLLGEKEQTEIGNTDLPNDLFSKEILSGTSKARARLLVEYLNKLSEAVCEKQHAKEKIHFCLSNSKNPKDHPTSTICDPNFVAIRIGQGTKPPSPLSVEVSVTGDLQPKESVTGDPQSEESVTSDHQSEDKQKLAWSQLETTGEIFSKGKTEDEATAEGASYTGYLLQARPDLVSVVGLFFNLKKFNFRVYFTDAWGVCQTHPINFKSKDTVPLLMAYIRRLYNPEARPNIKRAGDFSSKPTFTIDVDTHEQFTGCVLIRVGSPFHRRSTIFATPQGAVIKSQYVDKGRRFEEGPILQRIHESYDFPGVVRFMPATGTRQGLATVKAGSEVLADSSHESVANADGEERAALVRDECPDVDMTENTSAAEEGVSGAREDETTPDIDNATLDMDVDVEYPHKCRKDTRETLLVLQDKANLLMDAETPLEALIAFYDLLEVTRFLHKHRSIFHRDISAGNVLLREKTWVSEKPFENKFGDMCFATHLLGEKGPDKTASPLHTRVLLIDFDMAEDRGAQSREPSTNRSGTPMFMARLVRNPEIVKGGYCHEAMPQLQGFALERYQTCISDRLGGFPQNNRSMYYIEKDKEIQYSHRLSYDAESTVWLLLSWAMQAKPVKKEEDSEKESENWIPDHLWGNLTGGKGIVDPRRYFVSNFLEEVCHPVYQGLDELLHSLFKQLSGYHEQVARPAEEQAPSRMKDEYLHEAFQRTIFDFIVKNVEEPFMKTPISRTRRRRELGGVMCQRTVTPSIGVRRSYETMAGKEGQSSGQPNPIRPNPPNENPTFN